MAARFSATQSLTRTANLPSQTAFTMCGWGRLVTDRNAFSTVAGIEDSGGSNGLWIITDSDGTTLGIFDSGVGAFWSGSLAALTANADFFWGLTRTGTGAGQGTGYFRLASANAFTTQSQGATSMSITPARVIFGNDSSSEAWNGRLWNIKVWDRALTAAELLVESYFRRVMFPSSLNFHWPIDRHDSTQDFGGNGRNATVTGTLTTEDSNFGLWVPRRKIFLAPAVAGGSTTVTPTNASLSFAGQTVTALTQITAVPANASLSFQGLAPAAQTIITAQPTNASLSFQGAQPSVYLEMRVTPANASLSFQGQQAVMYLQNVITPGNASLSFAGLQPTIQTDAGLTVAPDNASLSFQGLAPVIAQGQTIVPSNASLSFAGAQPSLVLTFEATTVTPANASLSFQGLVPTISRASATRGHHNTGRRWRGRVYGLSYSDEVVLIPTVGRSDTQLPPPPPAPRVGLGALALAFVDPPRPSLTEADADREGRYARLRDDARRRIEREIAASRDRARRKRVQRAVAEWLDGEQSAIDGLTDLTKELVALRVSRRGSMTGRAR